MVSPRVSTAGSAAGGTALTQLKGRVSMRVGDAHEQLLADRTSVTVGSPTARPVGLRGEQVMTDRQHPAPFATESAQVKSCWMCGIRLPASQMVADGGSACHDVRWYCSDMWGCTRRWTSRPPRLPAIRPGAAEPHSARRTAARPDVAEPDVAEPSETPGEHSADLVAASPLHSSSPVISLPLLGHRIIYPVGMAIRGSPIYHSLAPHSLAGYFRTVHPQVMCATA